MTGIGTGVHACESMVGWRPGELAHPANLVLRALLAGTRCPGHPGGEEGDAVTLAMVKIGRRGALNADGLAAGCGGWRPRVGRGGRG